jgi:hypothetical protein
MSILRAFVGIFGFLLMLGAAFSSHAADINGWLRVAIGVFGLFITIASMLAPDKLIERWFGGI